MANNTDNKEAFDSRVSKLQKENELLLAQLHSAQEELECNYAGARNGGANVTVAETMGAANGHAHRWVAEELPEIHAENRRLQALVEMQKSVHQLESTHALNVRLGNILIEGVDAPVSLLSVPSKLVKVWRQSSRKVPPAALGGKDFSKVIAAWQSGGFDAVEKTMGAFSAAPVIKANAYTVLARHLGKNDRSNAAQAAQLAYRLDPRAFRLKWLAFRLHEAGSVIEAEAMLDLLPADTPFSESEARQAKQLRQEAKRARDSEAKQTTGFVERKAAADKQWNTLVHERDQQLKRAVDRAREVESLKLAKAKLEQEKAALTEKSESQAQLATERAREVEALKRGNAQLLADNASLLRDVSNLRNELKISTHKLGDTQLLLSNLHRVQEELEQVLADRESLQLANTQFETHARNVEAYGAEINSLKLDIARLERDNEDFESKLEKANDIADQRARELESLLLAKTVVDQEKQLLTVRHEVELRLAHERNREFDALTQTKTSLEQEKQSLAVKHEVQANVLAERIKELETLAQEKLRLEQDRQTLTSGLDAKTKAVEERTQQLEVLKQAKVKLESEKKTLTEGRDAQTRVAEERAREVETLKQVKAKLEQEKATLEKQKQIVTAKVNKGDADIDDLLVDLELFFNGKAIIYVDVGAYVGDVFLKIKRSSKKFRIHEAHLFEPNPNSYAQLTNKIAGSDSPVVHAYNLAVSDSTDAHRFVAAKSMTKALSADLQSETGPEDAFTARCVSLDSQASIFTDGKINLLKIDVEGKEMDVLSSARKLFESQSVDILYIEVGFNRAGTQQTYFAEVDQFLQAYGYRVLRIYEQKEEWMRDSPLLRRANIAYMSEKFANAHPLKLMQELQELKSRLNELSDGMLKSEK
jgi:FkbM family methyltransferase